MLLAKNLNEIQKLDRTGQAWMETKLQEEIMASKKEQKTVLL